MFKNKAPDGASNLCGEKIKCIRLKRSPKVSQRMLADELQRHALDIDKNAVQRIEAGKRFVTDLELKIIAQVLDVSYSELLDSKTHPDADSE